MIDQRLSTPNVRPFDAWRGVWDDEERPKLEALRGLVSVDPVEERGGLVARDAVLGLDEVESFDAQTTRVRDSVVDDASAIHPTELAPCHRGANLAWGHSGCSFVDGQERMAVVDQ
ncbi:hypothetical protein [Aeromicrobium terrae]|uniref:hypothetical protein n=1 Tax=Aeromicrobium terrae TaxID=2498846 RepID=UPI001C9CF27D|nr:hypothetical protein [Aeromicrobium terrae]